MLKYTPRSCYEELKYSYELRGNRVALVYFGNKMTLKYLIKEIDIFSKALVRLGIRKGDVFSIYLPNCPQAVIAFYALSKIGAIAHIVHPLMPEQKLFEMMKVNKSKGVLCFDLLVKNKALFENQNYKVIICSNSDYMALGKFVMRGFELVKSKRIRFSFRFRNLMNKHRHDPLIVNNEGDGVDIVTIMHSGGTSGEHKSISISNNALNYLCYALIDLYEDKTEKWSDYAIVVLPIFHAFGLGVAVHVSMWHGFSLILYPKFKVSKVIRAMKAYNVVCMAGVPLMFSKLLDDNKFYCKQIKNLKAVWCGGDELCEHEAERWDEAMLKYRSTARILRGYGLTEVCGVCSVNTMENYRKGSCGLAMNGCNIQIWDKEHKLLKPNTIGEIAIQSPAVMDGYINSKRDGIFRRGKSKWILSGDIGYMDEDGFLYVLGREKRVIKIAGINVFPSEIESVVQKLPYINEVCAVDTTKKGKIAIKLFYSIKKKPEYANIEDKKVIDDIKALCETELIKYSRPTIFKQVEALPRTKYAKVDYVKLKQGVGYE